MDWNLRLVPEVAIDDFNEIIQHQNQYVRKIHWVDCVMIEQFWRSLKLEEVYLKADESVIDVRDNI